MIPNLPSVELARVYESAALWRVVAPFSYRVNPGDIVTVPVGFVTDLASIPRVFWDVLPPFGNYTEAAVIHDFLYSDPEQRKRGKDACDKILEMAALDYGTPQWQVDMLYEGVRAGGQSAWDDDGKKSATLQKL